MSRLQKHTMMERTHVKPTKRPNNLASTFRTLFQIRTELERLENEQDELKKDVTLIIQVVDRLLEKMIMDFEESLFD